MRKNLFFTAGLLLASVSLLAQAKTVWNFSEEPFTSVSTVSGAFNNKVTYTTDDGLSIHGDGQYGWTYQDDSRNIHPEFDGVKYTKNMVVSGGTKIIPGHYTLPHANRYMAFYVNGKSDIEIIARSYNGTPAGKIVITDYEESFIDTVVTLVQGKAGKYTYRYNYDYPTRLYIYAADYTTQKNPGICIYSISATNVQPVVGEKTMWNFSEEPFLSMEGAGNQIEFNNKESFTTEDGLTLHGNGKYGWTYKTDDSPLNDNGVSYTKTMLTSGPVNVGSDTRYFSFPVKGPSSISIGAAAYQASEAMMGKIIITDKDRSFTDTVAFHTRQTTPTTFHYYYTGKATTLEVYPAKWRDGNVGVRFFYIAATNVDTENSSINANRLSQQTIYVENNDIINPENIPFGLYNMAGQLLFESEASRVGIQHLASGLYIIRDKAGVNCVKVLK